MSLILPPRLEDRAAADAAMLVMIPAYEETSASLRPTWLPVDPSTYAPPRITMKTFSFAMAGKVALGLVATFAVSFAMVVAPHFAREFAANHATANAAGPVVAAPVSTVAVAVTDASAAQPKAASSGVVLTVNVNDLPVSKSSARNRRAGRAGS